MRPKARLWTVALALTLVLLVEGGARLWSSHAKRWYERADEVLAEGPAEALFLGSSRVAAAIDEPAWSPGRAINIGRGYATWQEHYFGLRNLIERYPERMRAATVWIEAPGGLPDASTWDDAWANPDSPRMLTRVLRWSDLSRLWHAPIPFEDKAGDTFAMLLRPSELYAQKDRIGGGFLVLGQDIFAAWFTGESASNVRTDLEGAGGIRVDAESVKRSRELAAHLADLDIGAQRPVLDWERTVTADIVRMAKRSGAHVVFFEMPLSSVQARTYETDIRRRDRATFAEAAKRWGTPVIRASITVTDDDFPDLWHLRKSRTAEFTRALETQSRALASATAAQ